MEGCDNTGKTTLIENLIAELEPYLHSVKSSGPGEDLGERIISALKENDITAIHDRFFFSELVYGPIMRGKISITPDQMKQIHSLMASVNPLIIWCSRPLKDIAASFLERPQMEGTHIKLREIEEAYYRVMVGLHNEKGYNLMVYNYQRKGDYEKIAEAVERDLIARNYPVVTRSV